MPTSVKTLVARKGLLVNTASEQSMLFSFVCLWSICHQLIFHIAFVYRVDFQFAWEVTSLDRSTEKHQNHHQTLSTRDVITVVF